MVNETTVRRYCLNLDKWSNAGASSFGWTPGGWRRVKDAETERDYYADLRIICIVFTHLKIIILPRFERLADSSKEQLKHRDSRIESAVM